MKRTFLLFAVSAWSIFAQVGDRTFTTSLSATGQSGTYRTDSTDHTLQVVVVSPATCTIRLEGSLDGSNWFDLSGTKSCTSSTMFTAANGPITYVRANLLTYSGDAPAAFVKIAYKGSNTIAHITAAAPYVSIGGTKYVGATMWPFTAMFSGSYLDANTMTITTGANGSTQLLNSGTLDSWYSTAATSSIEGEFKLSASSVIWDEGMGPRTAGICLYDSTNSALKCIELTTEDQSYSYPARIRAHSYSYNGSGSPSFGDDGTISANSAGDGPVHFRVLKSVSNYSLQFSLDGGQNFVTLDSGSAGTIAKAIVRVGPLAVATILSLSVN